MISNSFINGFQKQVAAVAVICGDEILIGRRRDNGKWTNPGGHLHQNEDPKDGAKREVKEEAGLDCGKLEHIVSKKVTSRRGKELIIHAYKCHLSKKPKTTTALDPDKEVVSWKWVSIKNGLPKHILKNLHSPKNVLVEALGLDKEASAFWSGFTRNT